MPPRQRWLAPVLSLEPVPDCYCCSVTCLLSVALKRVSWFVLSAVTMAAAGVVARRVSTLLWSELTGEAPPTQNY